MLKQTDLTRRRLLKLAGGLGLAGYLPWLGAEDKLPNLLTKPIPSSGERLPVIGLGTSRVFNVGSDETERAALREVVDLLARVEKSMLDTSPMYGASEAVSGELIADLGVRDRLFIATKVWTEGREAGIAQMRESMRLLRAPTLDLMQIHNLVDWETHLHTLRDWKEQGIIRYIGITHYNEGAHAAVAEVMRRTPLDFVQINYSLAEPEAEKQILPLAEERGIAVIANRPFARGELFRAVKGQPLPVWAAEIGCASWAQFFLKFVVSHPAVTCAIPATGKAKHMLDNQGAGYGVLADAEQRRRMRDYMQERL